MAGGSSKNNVLVFCVSDNCGNPQWKSTVDKEHGGQYYLKINASITITEGIRPPGPLLRNPFRPGVALESAPTRPFRFPTRSPAEIQPARQAECQIFTISPYSNRITAKGSGPTPLPSSNSRSNQPSPPASAFGAFSAAVLLFRRLAGSDSLPASRNSG
jgi:hypothetical protein